MSSSADQRTDLFLALTPDRVLDAVEAGGLRCNPICNPLNSFENRVYDIQLEDENRIVAKFYRPLRWSQEQILEEHAFMGELEAAEIPICGLRTFPDGSTLKVIDGIFYCLYDLKGGRAPDEANESLLERLGMLIGRMHNIGEARDAPNRVRISADTYVRRNLAFLEENKVVAPGLWSWYRSLAIELADLADAWMEGVPTHRLHGDFHLGNLLFREGILHVLDFDDMVVGPAVQDFWMAIRSSSLDPTHATDCFLSGYEAFRPFDESSLRLIDVLRGLRLVHYATWLARRWHDPVFPRTWPHFGTEDYWQREATNLQEALQAAKTGEPVLEGGEAAKPEEEPELTNKDFFWDWDEE